jgi:hypothetical protein
MDAYKMIKQVIEPLTTPPCGTRLTEPGASWNPPSTLTNAGATAPVVVCGLQAQKHGLPIKNKPAPGWHRGTGYGDSSNSANSTGFKWRLVALREYRRST